MKTAKCLFVAVCLIAFADLTLAGPPKKVKQAAEETIYKNSAVTRPQRPASSIERAYRDVLSILSNDNSCSRFFLGPHTADEVLTQLVAQLQINLLGDSRTSIEMSGTFIYYSYPEKHFGYRLFTAAWINIRGPFFKAKVFPAEPYVPRVGSFQPNTRKARALILLHELAHLVRAQNGSWLIPDDGGLPALSKRNTEFLETQCRQQILSIGERDSNEAVWH